MREANAAADTIPAGIYSNVSFNDESGDLGGYELRLDDGSDSRTIEFVFCEGTCSGLVEVPVRRGLNGVFFEVSHGGRTVPVAVERTASGVAVNVDWGSGLETVQLSRVESEWGLRVARGL